ncbi:MAG TPA: hypothetical protein VMK12_29600 [Anaeromyxobacteraceae bacterium]|nr:hypothetical protein [Anaeromyxobacteraceae bacterium]
MEFVALLYLLGGLAGLMAWAALFFLYTPGLPHTHDRSRPPGEGGGAPPGRRAR